MVPPQGLKVAVAARHRAGDYDGSSWLRSLGWDRPGLARMLPLDRLEAEGIAEVLIGMGFPLAELGQRVDIVSELHRLSEGDPLLVRLYVDDLWTRGSEAARLAPADLRSLEPGLKGYFDGWWEQQLQLWGKDSPLRDQTVTALLSLLSCALGPLRRSELLHLVPDSYGLNEWSLDECLRAISRFVLGDGLREGYVFSHPRLAAYFYEERLTASSRAEWEARYLAWGRRVLGSLNEGTLLPDEAPPYLVQYYAAHLERANAGAETLLHLVSDGWRRAWERLEGSEAGFVTDTERAWRSCQALDAQETDAGRPAQLLAGEIKCALVNASVRSLAASIPPELVGALVREGMWTPIRGQAYARLAGVPSQRAAMLASLLPYAEVRDREGLLDETLSAIQKMPASEQGEMLAQIRPYIPARKRAELIEYIRRLNSAGSRARALAAFLLDLPEDERESVIDYARGAANLDRFQTLKPPILATLSLGLPEPRRTALFEEALGCARALHYQSKAIALLAVMRYAPEVTQRELALEARSASESRNLWDTAWVLSATASFLSEAEYQREARLLIKRSESVEYNWRRVQMLALLAPLLPKDERDVLTP